MKVSICNVPLRPEKAKTNYPPLGALAIVQSLRSAGYDPVFYDINYYRPTDRDLAEYFGKNRFDIVGISATVSTSYKYVKKLVGIIRSASPRSTIVLGGRLAASSEVIFRFVPIDYSVIGEGENIIVALTDQIRRNGSVKDEKALRGIKGLCFAGSDGKVVFTGYDRQPSVEEIPDPDYSLLERYSDINYYIHDPFVYEQFKHDERSFQDRRKGRKIATVVSARGCVNQCSFCHRWQRGVKIFPVDRVIAHIKYLADRYNVGFISFGDENFGASRKWIEEFVEKITPLDILYRVGGICADSVDPDILKKLKRSGCVAVHFGFESGCDRMLTVIEKRSNVETNLKAARWTEEAGLQTVPALVVGMPGENYGTIRETGDFINRITERLPKPPVLSINALVALPGTPVYEYARLNGILGKTLDDEEAYLLRVSDKHGSSLTHLNLTDYPYFIVQSWIRCIAWGAHYNYYVKNGLPLFSTGKLIGRLGIYLSAGTKGLGASSESALSNPALFRMRYFISPFFVMYKNFREDKASFYRRLLELFAWPFRKKRFKEYAPLRALVSGKIGNLNPYDVKMLRLGR